MVGGGGPPRSSAQQPVQPECESDLCADSHDERRRSKMTPIPQVKLPHILLTNSALGKYLARRGADAPPVAARAAQGISPGASRAPLARCSGAAAVP